MGDTKLYPTDPVLLTLADGKLRELRYTNGSFKRLKRALGLTTMREVFNLEFSEIAGDLIYVGLVDKDVNPEQIDELIPASMLTEVQAIVFAAISGSSVEDVKNGITAAMGQTPAPVTNEPQSSERGLAAEVSA